MGNSLGSIFLVGGWWIDPDKLGQGRMSWWPPDEPFGMGLKGEIKNGLAFGDKLRSLTIVNGRRCQ